MFTKKFGEFKSGIQLIPDENIPITPPEQKEIKRSWDLPGDEWEDKESEWSTENVNYKNIKTFEEFLNEDINVDDIKFKSTKTWYNKHSKIYSKEEEDELLKDLKRAEEKLKEMEDSFIGHEEDDPNREENWDNNILMDFGGEKEQRLLINIIKERLKILRSFK